jgi:hypothetical protein
MRKLILFLSYARPDAQLADGLRAQLAAEGHEVWQDTEELLAGDSFESHIRRTLRSCDGYIVLVTSRSLGSPWVWIEFGGAWIGGVKIFPVVDESVRANLPGPLSRFSSCALEEVTSKLLPALARLQGQILAPQATEFTGSLIDELARDCTARIAPASLGRNVALFVADAMSPHRVARRMAHTAVQQSPLSLRSAFLNVMSELSEHTNYRIRGEAFYCLGYIPVQGQSYMRPQEFFRHGLSDESAFVQACCANVLKNFLPLEESTVEMLQQRLSSNIFRVQSSKSAASLVYYASIALNNDRLLTGTEV